MASNLNRVVLTGNLTADPELRTLSSGTAVCQMRIASNTRRRTDDGWEDKANYFDVVAWGGQAEACARYLKKGSPLAIEGRLEWREWQTRDGQQRQSVEIVAENVQFLDGRSRDADQTQEAIPSEELGRSGEEDPPF